jgi:hypothetical protein
VSTRLSHAKREKRASTHDIWSLPAFPERLEAFVLRQLVPRLGAPMPTEASKDATQYPGHAHRSFPARGASTSDEYTLHYPLLTEK